MASTLTTLTFASPTVTLNTEANTTGTLSFKGTWGGAVLKIEYAQTGDAADFVDLPTAGSPIQPPFNANGGFTLDFPGSKLKLTAVFPSATTSIDTELTTP